MVGPFNSVSVSCDSGSKLYHEGAVRDRVTSTIAKRLGVPVSPRTPHNNNNNNSNSNSNSTPAESRHEAATAGGKNANRRKRRAAARSEQATANADPEVAVAGQYRGAYNLEHVSLPPAVHDVFVHIERNQVELAVNASGELLHKRGYRKHAVGSPIRETLAAACLRMAAGAVWADGDDNGAGSRASTEQEQQASAPPLQPPLWDPFCGSGTYVLEALDACVGLLGPLPRRFAFEFWPTHDSTGYVHAACSAGTACAYCETVWCLGVAVATPSWPWVVCTSTPSAFSVGAGRVHVLIVVLERNVHVQVQRVH